MTLSRRLPEQACAGARQEADSGPKVPDIRAEANARCQRARAPLGSGRRAGSKGSGMTTATAGDRTLHILLIEDDEVDVMNVRRAFQKNHIANPLYVATNGLEALELLRGGRIPRERRMVLLDLNMPQMNGIEFLRELRGDPELRVTPVVVLTTS